MTKVKNLIIDEVDFVRPVQHEMVDNNTTMVGTDDDEVSIEETEEDTSSNDVSELVDDSFVWSRSTILSKSRELAVKYHDRFYKNFAIGGLPYGWFKFANVEDEEEHKCCYWLIFSTPYIYEINQLEEVNFNYRLTTASPDDDVIQSILFFKTAKNLDDIIIEFNGDSIIICPLRTQMDVHEAVKDILDKKYITEKGTRPIYIKDTKLLSFKKYPTFM